MQVSCVGQLSQYKNSKESALQLGVTDKIKASKRSCFHTRTFSCQTENDTCNHSIQGYMYLSFFFFFK